MDLLSLPSFECRNEFDLELAFHVDIYFKLINQEPDLWKEVFVPESGKPTHLQSDDFMSLVKPPTYLSKVPTNVYAWFTEFVKDYGNLTGKFT